MSQIPLTLISLKEAAKRTSLNRATIWTMVRDGVFPRPILIGKRRKAFVESEVAGFIKARIAARDGVAA